MILIDWKNLFEKFRKYFFFIFFIIQIFCLIRNLIFRFEMISVSFLYFYCKMERPPPTPESNQIVTSPIGTVEDLPSSPMAQQTPPLTAMPTTPKSDLDQNQEVKSERFMKIL